MVWSSKSSRVLSLYRANLAHFEVEITQLKFVMRQREKPADAVDMEDIGKMMKKGRAANAEQVKGPPKVGTLHIFLSQKIQNNVSCLRSSLFFTWRGGGGGRGGIQDAENMSFLFFSFYGLISPCTSYNHYRYGISL
jgi:hypothetical protein